MKLRLSFAGEKAGTSPSSPPPFLPIQNGAIFHSIFHSPSSLALRAQARQWQRNIKKTRNQKQNRKEPAAIAAAAQSPARWRARGWEGGRSVACARAGRARALGGALGSLGTCVGPGPEPLARCVRARCSTSAPAGGGTPWPGLACSPARPRTSRASARWPSPPRHGPSRVRSQPPAVASALARSVEARGEIVCGVCGETSHAAGTTKLPEMPSPGQAGQPVADVISAPVRMPAPGASPKAEGFVKARKRIQSRPDLDRHVWAVSQLVSDVPNSSSPEQDRTHSLVAPCSAVHLSEAPDFSRSGS